jgi:acyl carrier protein
MSAGEGVYARVARVLVEALDVDDDEVWPAATLRGDLGAGSIDLLDIVFRLEREFGIEIPRGELFPDSVFRGGPDFVRDGRVTDRCMAEMRSRMPYAYPDLFTVAQVSRYVARQLGPCVGAGQNTPEFVPVSRSTARAPGVEEHLCGRL